MLKLSFVITLILFLCCGFVRAQSTLDGGQIDAIIKSKQKAIAIRSSNADWAALAELAFTTHGGYRLAGSSQPAFTFVIEPTGANSASLVIESGRPAKVLYSETLKGNSSSDALLRACDRAVEKTLGIPGYFAGQLAFVADRSGNREIWSSDLFFQNAKQITGHRSKSLNPNWSPDGDKLLYTSYFSNGFPDIMLMDMRTRKITKFAGYKGTNSGGAFSPDGRQVAMILSATGNSELYVAPISTKKPKRLTSTRGVESSPSWSPDSRRIVYTSDEPGGPQIFIIPASGGTPRYLNTRLSRYIDEPDWNPRDADKILFTAAAGGGYQIGVINLSTNRATWLTKAGNNSEACWLNDGRHIIYVQKRGSWSGLRILDTETGKDTALSPSQFGNTWQPAFVYPR